MKKVEIVVVLLIVVVVGWYGFSYYQQSRPPQKVWQVAFLALDAKDIQNENLLGLKARLEVLGYKEGKNIVYTVEIGEREEKSPRSIQVVAKELNEGEFDIILTGSTSATEALKNLSDLKKPVFFLAAGRPRALVENLDSPEGLITGMGEATSEFAEKRLQILKEAVPSIKKVATIIEKDHKTALATLEAEQNAAKKLGIEIEVIVLENLFPGDAVKAELLEKLKLIKKERGIDGYIACTCGTNETYTQEIADHMLKEKIPSVNPELHIGANLGWMISFSNDRRKAGERAADLVASILGGKPIAEIPVTFGSDTVYEINLSTAQAIGLELPESMLLGAAEIYR